MKVGTDGVLLGAWAEGGNRVLDVGTGTGLVALMMAQRFPQALVEAIEIDGEAATQARENVERSEFADRIHVIAQALQQFEPEARYDAIVSNPPYYINTLTPPDARRSLARSADSLSPADLMDFARRHLTPEGRLSVVIPADQVGLMEGEASMQGLLLTRKLLVKTTPRKPFKRALLTFSPTRQGPAIVESQNLLNPDGSRSDWYQALTTDFYIK